MADVYKIVPATSTYFEEIEANSPEEAMEIFAARMDLDMNAYFKAVKSSKQLRIQVTDIEWDWPSKKNDALPSEVTIEVDSSSPLLENIHNDAENLAEYLVEKYECCLCGFFAEVEEVDTDG